MRAAAMARWPLWAVVPFLSQVLTVRRMKPKVLRPVVRRIVVHMVDDLTRCKRPAE
jgi:hypothetical protein